MKYLFSISIICVLFSCNTKNEAKPEAKELGFIHQSLIGKWRLETINGEDADYNYKFSQLEFTENKKIYSSPGKVGERVYYYEIKDSTINGGSANSEHVVEINKDKLIIIQKRAEYGGDNFSRSGYKTEWIEYSRVK